jgi:hypothetical protein
MIIPILPLLYFETQLKINVFNIFFKLLKHYETKYKQ